MTNLQVVKALESQVDASYKRSASDPEEQRLRSDIRRIQEVFRKAHKQKVAVRAVRQATSDMMRTLSPAMGRELQSLLDKY